MYYPEDVIRDVREKSDIVTVISRYVTLQKKGHNYFGLCPFHGEKTPSFSVNATDQYYHCFGCGAGGNVFTFLQNVENMTFVEALTSLAQEAGVTLPQTEMSPQEKAALARREMMYEANKEAARFFYAQLTCDPSARAAREYLERRKVSIQYLRRFGLGYAPVSRGGLCRYLEQKGYPYEMQRALNLASGTPEKPYDFFFNRIMFPIFDVKGRVIAFGGRVIGQGQPKYLNTSDTELFNKRRNLYGMNLARRSRRRQALLVEGYMDVFSLHQAGFDNAVASLGTALTPEQALLIRRYYEEVCVIYDTDGAGTNAARRAIPILEQAGLRVRVMWVPGTKDPDEFIKENGAEAFEKQIEAAYDPVAFELVISDTSTVDGQVETLRNMRERLMNIEDDAERQLRIRDVAERLHIQPETLARQVEEARQNAGSAEFVKARTAQRRSRRPESVTVKGERELLAVLLRYPELRGTVFAILTAEDLPSIDFEAEPAGAAVPSGMPQEGAPVQSGDPPGGPNALSPSPGEMKRDVYAMALRHLAEHPQQAGRLADLISLTDRGEEQALLSQVGLCPLPETQDEIVKLTTEILRMLKNTALDEELRRVTDITRMQEILRQKKEVEQMRIVFN